MLSGQSIRILISVAVVLQLSSSYARGQENGRPIIQQGNEQVRIVFPAGEQVRPEDMQRLIDIFTAQAPLAGFPGDLLSEERVTISLATDPTPGMDAISRPSERLIILPLANVFEWEDKKKYRVIRHELAHIGMELFLNEIRTPQWLQEGFAEWAAGGLTCEGEARIRLSLMNQRGQGGPSLSALSSPDLLFSRVSYDYFATFVEYLDERRTGAVTDGTLLRDIKRHGVRNGLLRTFGTDLDELQTDWQAHLLERYSGLPEDLACEAN